MTIITILQARMSSSRLPGKVLKPILGEPMLWRQIERIKRAKKMGKLIVATSVQKEDEAVARLCAEKNIDCYRGNLEDVLERFYFAAVQHAPQHVVRLTGDCPLIDPLVIDAVLDKHLAGNFDYTTNALKPTYPDGLDVEVMRFSVLQQAYHEAALPSEREHVTPFIHTREERFKLGHVCDDNDFSHLRWTVDAADDFDLVEKIYSALYPHHPEFTTQDILQLLAKYPELQKLNIQHKRNEGMLKSLAKDKE